MFRIRGKERLVDPEVQRGVLARVLSILRTEVEDLEEWQVDLCQGVLIHRARATMLDILVDMTYW